MVPLTVWPAAALLSPPAVVMQLTSRMGDALSATEWGTGFYSMVTDRAKTWRAGLKGIFPVELPKLRCAGGLSGRAIRLPLARFVPDKSLG